ncbi:MAG: hypothetical protein LUD39_04985 [Opitutae bacterium]|nr:hypothetical protein [Opitutae bacterium]MCD8299093.1 hypothetical protein [Opitutae bacterium]
MSQENTTQDPQQTPAASNGKSSRLLCAFAAFFTLAFPAFAIAIGAGTHIAWNELAVVAEMHGDEANQFAVKILDNNQILLWAIFVVAIILCVYVFSLARKNNAAETFYGAGRIIFAMAVSAMLSVLYLGALTVAVFVLIAPLLAK